MTLYEKTIDGQLVRKSAKKITIIKDDRQIFNPTHEMIIADGWVVYNPPTPSQPTIEEQLANAKQMKVYEIEHFDQSEAVNKFFINEIPVWLDKATRAGLKLRFEAEIALGATETSLWYNDTQFPLKLNDAVNMLYALEVYASACYDNTQQHKANVKKLETIEDVDMYEYRTGYPDYLRF